MVWRKDFFEWEFATFNKLQTLLANVTLVNEVVGKALWMHHSSGSYNVKSFLILMLDPLSTVSPNYSYVNIVWIALTPPRFELLLWFLVISKLNAKDRILRLNIR